MDQKVRRSNGGVAVTVAPDRAAEKKAAARRSLLLGTTVSGIATVPGGLRLDLPAGEALLLRAGEEREVTVIVGPG